MRRTWYGWGSLARAEKSWFGRILDDIVYVYADISVFSLPVLMYVWVYDPFVDLGLTAPALTAWFVMVAVATLLRGGSIAPLGSETLGWVSTRLPLLLLRLVYYNVTLAVAIYGSLALAGVLGSPWVAVVAAGSVGTAATLAFPTVADIFYDRFSAT